MNRMINLHDINRHCVANTITGTTNHCTFVSYIMHCLLDLSPPSEQKGCVQEYLALYIINIYILLISLQRRRTRLLGHLKPQCIPSRHTSPPPPYSFVTHQETNGHGLLKHIIINTKFAFMVGGAKMLYNKGKQ